MLLRVEVEERDDHAIVTASGEIDAATAGSVEEAVLAALDGGRPRVLLDFTDVTFIDSTGLGVLVKAHRHADSLGATFAVVRPTSHTRKLMRVLGLDQLLRVYETTDEALADGPKVS